jgi:tetratricopeptide (TPR) repeat protein
VTDRKDFFISYNQHNRNWAEWIAWTLEEAGYSVIIQAWDFRAGHDFVEKMQQALAESTAMVAVLSPTYLESKHCMNEWRAAYEHDPDGSERALIAVGVEQCELRPLMKQRIFFKLIDLTRDEARQRLLAEVNKERPKPAQEPAFPGQFSERSDERPQAEPTFPGPIFHVPFHRNRHFTGREELLESIATDFASGGHGSQVKALYGLGGMGKTQTALEYCYRHRSEYTVVWWMTAETSADLAVEYGTLAVKLGLVAENDPDPQRQMEYVKAWLERNSGWLLVFDDAPNADAVTDYLPKIQNGHVLITSRHSAWEADAESTQVQEMLVEDAIGFLVSRTGRTDEQKDAGDLAKTLGCLPLALEQAGAYISRRRISLSKYVSLFETARQKLYKFPPDTAYNSTVAATWQVSFDQAAEDNPASTELLRLLAFFAADDIPLDVVRQHADTLPPPLDEAGKTEYLFLETIGPLLQYSLVTRSDDDTASVHRLVQDVTRDQMTDDEKKTWAGAAVKLLSAAKPDDFEHPNTWPEWARLLPHIMAASDRAQEQATEPLTVAVLLDRAGSYLWKKALLKEAKTLLQRALTLREQELGPDHPDVASVLSNLATVLQDLGELKDARVYLERAIAIQEKAYDADHPVLARSYSNLATVLQDLGELKDARVYLERAIAIDEKAYDADHPVLATRYSNLALVLQDLGELKDAREYLERAIAIQEKAYEPDHPNLAACYGNLATVLKNLGELQEARGYLERAIIIKEKAYDADHPTLAVSYSNLATVLQDLGELQDARVYLERAIAIEEKAYDADHPTLAMSYSNLAVVLRDLGELQEARVYLERAIAIDKKAYDADHPTLARSYSNLAWVLYDQGDSVEAKRYFLKALNIAMARLEPDHPTTKNILVGLETVEAALAARDTDTE